MCSVHSPGPSQASSNPRSNVARLTMFKNKKKIHVKGKKKLGKIAQESCLSHHSVNILCCMLNIMCVSLKLRPQKCFFGGLTDTKNAPMRSASQFEFETPGLGKPCAKL